MKIKKNRIFVLVITALLCTIITSTIAKSTERDTLIDLYNNTNGENWIFNTNWLEESGTECTWFGVLCDDSNHVVSLHLFNNNLAGTIPSSIQNLTYLKSLILHNNMLTGNIPNELFKLKQLESITLNNNDLNDNLSTLYSQYSNCDDKIGIQDAIYALKIVAGIKPINKIESISSKELGTITFKYESEITQYDFYYILDSNYNRVLEVNFGNQITSDLTFHLFPGTYYIARENATNKAVHTVSVEKGLSTVVSATDLETITFKYESGLTEYDFYYILDSEYNIVSEVNFGNQITSDLSIHLFPGTYYITRENATNKAVHNVSVEKELNTFLSATDLGTITFKYESGLTEYDFYYILDSEYNIVSEVNFGNQITSDITFYLFPGSYYIVRGNPKNNNILEITIRSGR